MTGGEKAYALLLEAEENANALWTAAKEAQMDRTSVEVIRNYVGGLKTIRENWEQERSRWEPTDA